MTILRPITTRTWIVNKRPKCELILDGENATFKLTEQELPPLGPNQVLVKSVYFGNAPAQREWIEPAFEESESLYRAPIKEGQVMGTRGLGQIIESTSSRFSKGQWIKAATGWTEYFILNDTDPDLVEAAALPDNLSRTHYLGALGNTGFSAYYGYVVVGDAHKDETVVVSAAAGATGSMVVQIARNIIGARKIIGIAGTDDKCRWVESLGADYCLNYRSPFFLEDLKRLTPEGVDLYFDGVGGDILDQLLLRMNLHGKIIACGSMSGYNSGNGWISKNYYQIVLKRLSLKGFILSDYLHKVPEVLAVFKDAIRDGRLRINSESETVIDTKFEDVPKTWMMLFSGVNTGKLITKLVE